MVISSIQCFPHVTHAHMQKYSEACSPCRTINDERFYLYKADSMTDRKLGLHHLSSQSILNLDLQSLHWGREENSWAQWKWNMHLLVLYVQRKQSKYAKSSLDWTYSTQYGHQHIERNKKYTLVKTVIIQTHVCLLAGCGARCSAGVTSAATTGDPAGLTVWG